MTCFVDIRLPQQTVSTLRSQPGPLVVSACPRHLPQGPACGKSSQTLLSCQTKAAPPGNGDSCSKLGTAPEMMDLGAQRG